MEISCQPLEANVMLICLDGRLDATTSLEVKSTLQELVEQNYTKFIVDLASVPFIDSSGLASLVSGLRMARENQGTLVLTNIQPQAQTVFRLTMLDRVFSIYTGLDDAQRNLA